MLSEVTLIIIDELSMVSNNLSTDIDSRLGEKFMMIPEKVFADLTVITVADLLQLPLIRVKLIFSHFCDKDSIKHLLDLQLWYLFKCRINLSCKKMINCLLSCLMKFGLVTLMMM